MYIQTLACIPTPHAHIPMDLCRFLILLLYEILNICSHRFYKNRIFYLGCQTFNFPHRMAPSGLQEMFSIIPLVVDVSQEIFSSTKLLVASTSVVLCDWYSCCSWWLLTLSSGVVNRTLSHICGRLYSLMFLLRLLTLMQIDSLIDLERLYPSLPTMLTSSNVVLWPVLDWCSHMGKGALRCPLYLSP